MRAPRGLRRKAAIAASVATSLCRAVRGLKARPSKAPDEPLELYSFESSPYSRLVRERLSELELPYVLRNTWDRLVFTGTGLAPTQVHSEDEMRQKVQETPGAIGYLPSASASAERKSP